MLKILSSLLHFLEKIWMGRFSRTPFPVTVLLIYFTISSNYLSQLLSMCWNSSKHLSIFSQNFVLFIKLKMYQFSRLVLCATLTLILLVIELVLTHFTHCISLLAVANQSMYNLLTLVISASTIIVSNETVDIWKFKYFTAITIGGGETGSMYMQS